jgi:molybdate/tungstate transport system substrate-binding protein
MRPATQALRVRLPRPLCILRAAVLTATLGVILTPTSHAAVRGSVSVLYAASLASLNEKIIGPSFSRRTGYGYAGKARGSLAIATAVRDGLERPDVIELADPAVNTLLMKPASSAEIRWYFTFARTQLVVGFNSHSPFASKFKAVQRRKLPWYRALEQQGLQLGRTDPNLDPKGYRTLFMARLAQQALHLKKFQSRVLGADENPSQVFPEEVLVSRLLTGQIDAGIFYLSEVRELHLPFFRLPGKINLGEPKYGPLYRKQIFHPRQGVAVRGAPILYTVSVATNARNPSGGSAFVRFILSKRGRNLASGLGLLSAAVKLHGSRTAVPKSLLPFIQKK